MRLRRAAPFVLAHRRVGRGGLDLSQKSDLEMTVEPKNAAAGSFHRGQGGSVRDLARFHAQAAIEVLTGIMSGVNAAAAVRVAAAHAVLAFGDRMRAADSAPKGKNGLEVRPWALNGRACRKATTRMEPCASGAGFLFSFG